MGQIPNLLSNDATPKPVPNKKQKNYPIKLLAIFFSKNAFDLSQAIVISSNNSFPEKCLKNTNNKGLLQV